MGRWTLSDAGKNVVKSRRSCILRNNQALREGTAQGVRRLEDGEVVFRIPAGDMKVLTTLYPELASPDTRVQLAAWKKLRASPVGRQYMVTRTPQQVKKSAKGIIIR